MVEGVRGVGEIGDELRTLNIERPMMNEIVESHPPLLIHSMFNVGRSLFDVQNTEHSALLAAPWGQSLIYI
ncbi:MAG TPA: hypothetical protein DCX06_07410 [Opitutae bacterium]|nr:hypothetical protein [Opitutae bacterium]